MMQVFDDLKKWQTLTQNPEYLKKQIGFVPTMGALHEGHQSLFQRSVAENEMTVASIFVNPTQFNDVNDYHKYPRCLEDDLKVLESCGVNYCLLPKYEEIYSDNYRFRIVETQLSQKLCGAYRPGHFTGVLTIVLKLLNLVKPQRAYFGEKDFQQYRLIQDMAKAFFLQTQIIGCPTVRTREGLALSSRNQRLNAQERELAVYFAQQLSSANSVEVIRENLQKKGLRVEYIEEYDNRRLGAVYVGDVRLIDNVPL